MLLQLKDLSVAVGKKQVLRRVNLTIEEGEVVLLAGKNGGGKSTLAQVLMGNDEYTVVEGEMEFEGKKLLAMSVDERARAGVFLAYQTPIVIPGVKVFTLCKTAYEAQGKKIKEVLKFKQELEKLAERVGLSRDHVVRSVNEGFSGGEKKRLELLQLLLLRPKLAILDEVDSGLDQEGRIMMREIVQEMSRAGAGVILISHDFELKKKLKINKVWVMEKGKLGIPN